MDYFIKLCSSYKLELVKNEEFKTLFDNMSKNEWNRTILILIVVILLMILLIYNVV